MPIEYTQLRDQPQTICQCTQCFGYDLYDRGLIQSWWRKLLGMKYCAVVCLNCNVIIGYEKPEAH